MFLQPNITFEGDNFYISYNWADTKIYGTTTTALVVDKEQMRYFYILNGGEYFAEYKRIIKEGGDLKVCLDYFEKNIDKINRLSNKLDREELVKEGYLKA